MQLPNPPQGGHWEVTDTSTNGTFVNGTKVGKGNKATLMPGQTLGLSVVTAAGQLPAADYINTVE
jgi:pSer/pThr/pTyr-binding forkhead associated (FHA) protein